MFNFTPLLGARASSPASQSLLEFEGGIKILVDVGWDVDFDVSKLKALERYVQVGQALKHHNHRTHINSASHYISELALNWATSFPDT